MFAVARLFGYHIAHCFKDVRLVPAHHDPIMVVVDIEHLAIPFHDSLIDFSFSMKLKKTF